MQEYLSQREPQSRYEIAARQELQAIVAVLSTSVFC
jgi:hypothetical protein